MKFLPLIFRNLGRRKLRTAFTVASIAIAFLLFGLLSAVRVAFSQGTDVAGIDRLISINKISLILQLPIKYKSQIGAIDGVEQVTHQDWFGGFYQDQRNQFQNIAVAENYFEVFPEYVLPEEQKLAWLQDRQGAVVGRKLAEKFGWAVGDRIPLQATIWPRRDGSRTWEFVIDGIYDGATDKTDTTGFFFHHEYLVQAGSPGGGPVPEDFVWDEVGWYTIKIADPARAHEISDAIDERFANSDYETETTTEKAFAQGFANQVGNIGAIVTGIVAVVFFTLLLVAGNTMAQAVRERTGEMGVMKTLGFTDRQVMGLVLLESLLLACVGGLPALLVAYRFVQGLDLGISFVPSFYIPGGALALGVGLVFALGLVTGAIPAWQALRLDIVKALRRS